MGKVQIDFLLFEAKIYQIFLFLIILIKMRILFLNFVYLNESAL